MALTEEQKRTLREKFPRLFLDRSQEAPAEAQATAIPSPEAHPFPFIRPDHARPECSSCGRPLLAEEVPGRLCLPCWDDRARALANMGASEVRWN